MPEIKEIQNNRKKLKAKSCFFENINIIDKPLTQVIKQKIEKTQVINNY